MSFNHRHYGVQFYRNQSAGFTIIELLVVVVILGLLAAIALPAFLSQAARAQQTKALNYVGAMNRAQHSFFYEKARFASSLDELGFSNLNGEEDYTYAIESPDPDLTLTSAVATPKDPVLRGYAGLVYTNLDSANNAIMSSLVCEGGPNAVPAPTASSANGQVQIAGCD